MKRLLDENLPKKLKSDLLPHEVFTVKDMGWSGIKNGELLKRMQDEHFSALLTVDKNLQHQQNFNKYPLPVLVLNVNKNTHAVLVQLVPQILQVLSGRLKTGATIINSIT